MMPLSREQQEEAARQAWYSRFDMAVATLSPDVRNRAHLGGFLEQEDGSWEMFDAIGHRIGHQRTVESIRANAESGERRTSAPQGISGELLAKSLRSARAETLCTAMKVVGPALVELDEKIGKLEQRDAIDGMVIEELAATMERVESLEKSGPPLVRKFLGVDTGDQAPTLDLDSRIDAAIARYFVAHPVPQGRDGRGVQSALIDRDGELVLTMTDGLLQRLGRVVGSDGVSLESRELSYDRKKNEIVERWSARGNEREFRYPAAGISYLGYWREGMSVPTNGTVTNNGSLWIAKRQTTTKPCAENSEDWCIAARKGRDAK